MFSSSCRCCCSSWGLPFGGGFDGRTDGGRSLLLGRSLLGGRFGCAFGGGVLGRSAAGRRFGWLGCALLGRSAFGGGVLGRSASAGRFGLLGCAFLGRSAVGGGMECQFFCGPF